MSKQRVNLKKCYCLEPAKWNPTSCFQAGRIQTQTISPLSWMFSSNTVFVSVSTFSEVAWMSLWCVTVLGSSKLPGTHCRRQKILLIRRQKWGSSWITWHLGFSTYKLWIISWLLNSLSQRSVHIKHFIKESDVWFVPVRLDLCFLRTSLSH